jgi:hypothetical protein
MIHQFPFFYFRLRFLPFPPDSGTSLETTIEASIGFGLIYGSMAREIDRSEPEITADASGALPSESELGEVDISRWLMTRRNVASDDCRSDVSAGLPGIAYVTSFSSSCAGFFVVRGGEQSFYH